MVDYIDLLNKNENWLMYRILDYAQKYDYAKYTSTLPEPWRLSISGLSSSFIQAVDHFSGEIPELHPDEKFTEDPISEFGTIEAHKHRQRGITLGMFLGLMKYYRESYSDLFEQFVADLDKRKHFHNFTMRCFDRIEIAFCSQWSEFSSDNFIKELQDSNRKLTNEKNKYLTIFESSFVPMVFLDKKGRLVNLNQAATNLFTDYAVAGTVYYNTLAQHDHNGHKTEQLTRLADVNSDGLQVEKCLETRNGKRLFLVKLHRMYDVSKKFEGTVVMLEDITEKRKAENALIEREEKYRLLSEKLQKLNAEYISTNEELQASTEELRVLNENLASKNEMLSELNATKDKLFSIIAHDLKSPFNSLLGFSEVLVKDAENFEPDKILEIAQIINKTSNQTYKLLENLLDWSRAQTGRLNPKLTKTRPSELIASTLEVCQQMSDAKQLELTAELHTNDFVFADEEMIKTVLRNLVTNALKFTHPRGKVTIRTRPQGTNVQFEVSDTGIGIQHEYLDQLFGITNKLSKQGTANEKGTGLGLMLCKEFVEKNNGEIWVESEPGKGSHFKFTLGKYPD